MRKHTVCCSLQTSTSNPYSRGTLPQLETRKSTKSTRPVWPNFPTNNRVHLHSWAVMTSPRKGLVSHMTELSLTSCCVSTQGSELRITQLYMRKHTQCCSLQTSTANPYSRGTSPQTVPSSSTKGTRPVWPNFPTNNRAHEGMGASQNVVLIL